MDWLKPQFLRIQTVNLKEEEMGIKLNLGASPLWSMEGWHTLDHKLTDNTDTAIAGDASDIRLPDESCDFVFCSHVFEHIPHSRLPLVVSEVNRILKPGGIFRMLTPDLEVLAKAYAEKDEEFWAKALDEDENLRTDLGFGGMLMNCCVSPGQDTVLLDRNLQTFIAGYAHLYTYDYQMMSTIWSKLGFNCRKAKFNDSELAEVRTPLHVTGFDPVWQNFNQKFYADNGLVHRLIDGKYEINFTVTGFDRDPVTSLIIEGKKTTHVNKEEANSLFNFSEQNYNRYSYSLLRDENFTDRLTEMGISYPDIKV